MKEHAKKVIWGASIVLMFFLAWYLFTRLESPTPPVEEPEGPIRVGVVLPLSGERATEGVLVQRSLQLAQERINDRTGVYGRDFELIAKDSRCDAFNARSLVQDMVADGVRYFIGGICEAATEAAMRVAVNNGGVWLAPTIEGDALLGTGNGFVRLSPRAADAARYAAHYVIQGMGARSAAVVSETTEADQQARRAFKDAFTEEGGTLVADEVFGAGRDSFEAVALKMKATKPDVIYSVGSDIQKTIALITTFQEQRVRTPVITTSEWMDEDFAAEEPDVVQSVRLVRLPVDLGRPPYLAFAELYQERFGEEVALHHGMSRAYTSLYLLKEAIEESGDNATGVRAWMLTPRRADDFAAYPFRINNEGNAEYRYELLIGEGGKMKFLQFVDVRAGEL